MSIKVSTLSTVFASVNLLTEKKGFVVVTTDSEGNLVDSRGYGEFFSLVEENGVSKITQPNDGIRFLFPHTSESYLGDNMCSIIVYNDFETAAMVAGTLYTNAVERFVSRMLNHHTTIELSEMTEGADMRDLVLAGIAEHAEAYTKVYSNAPAKIAVYEVTVPRLTPYLEGTYTKFVESPYPLYDREWESFSWYRAYPRVFTASTVVLGTQRIGVDVDYFKAINHLIDDNDSPVNFDPCGIHSSFLSDENVATFIDIARKLPLASKLYSEELAKEKNTTKKYKYNAAVFAHAGAGIPENAPYHTKWVDGKFVIILEVVYGASLGRCHISGDAYEDRRYSMNGILSLVPRWDAHVSDTKPPAYWNKFHNLRKTLLGVDFDPPPFKKFVFE